MLSDHAVPLRARSSLFVVSIAAAGALGGHLLRHPAPPPRAELRCVLPSIEEADRVAIPLALDEPPRAHEMDHRTVTADLLSLGPRMPDCGDLLAETPMVFTDVYADNATLRVLVPCAEMPRPMYSPSAGNAPVLREQARYRLELSGPIADDPAGKNDALWRADRIDVVAPSRPQRAAIADRLCVEVWVPSCGRR